MNRKYETLIASGVVATVMTVAATVVICRSSHQEEIKVLTGCILRDDPDSRKQLPLENVEIDVDKDVAADMTRSQASGLFRLNLRPGIEPGRTILLRLRHSDYEPLNIYEEAADKLYILHMAAIPHAPALVPEGPEVAVSSVRVRYTETSTTTLNVGSAGKILEVINTGNVSCDKSSVCSPDGKWKASIGKTSLDAGGGNSFQDARLTCIAGPCAFTKVDDDGFSRGGRTISASVRNWSDPVTFLLEAQVVHTMVGDVIRQSYPVKLGHGMDFTLPPMAQGPSIEAEIDQVDVVYPLGPTLVLSWLTCGLKIDADQAKLYHCDLKPGYRFQ
jgi:hypothetical protein